MNLKPVAEFFILVRVRVEELCGRSRAFRHELNTSKRKVNTQMATIFSLLSATLRCASACGSKERSFYLVPRLFASLSLGSSPDLPLCFRHAGTRKRTGLLSVVPGGTGSWSCRTAWASASQHADLVNGVWRPAIVIERVDALHHQTLGSNLGSATLRAVSAPKTGNRRSGRSPICLSTEAWSQ